MKKTGLFTFIAILVSFVSISEGISPTCLPDSSHYCNRQTFYHDFGADGVLSGRVEIAVYTGYEAEVMREITGYTGAPENAAFVYAYQIFCDITSTADLTYFAEIGINPDAITSVDTDISQAESLIPPNPMYFFDSYGVKPSPNGYFNDSKTKAIWEFEADTLVAGTQSWFLFRYSNYDWEEMNFEFSTIPEPATVAFLALGGLSMLRWK